jgi:hypothetical protein
MLCLAKGLGEAYVGREAPGKIWHPPRGRKFVELGCATERSEMLENVGEITAGIGAR